MYTIRAGIGTVLVAALLLAGCAVSPSGHVPATPPVHRAVVAADVTESPQAAAQRLLPEAAALLRRSHSRLTTAALAASHVATLEPVIPGYHGGLVPVPVPWVVANDVSAMRGDLFAAMRPSTPSTDTFVVRVDSNGGRLFQFWMELYSGRWRVLTVGAGGDAVERQLIARLGPGTQVRRALLLPSGLVVEVARNGSREALLLATLFNYGPGITGFDGVLPWHEVLTPVQFRRVLHDERKHARKPSPGTMD